MSYLCTLKLARAIWPELKSKALGSLAQHLGIRFRHHNAGEDALVCAWVAIAAARIVGAFDLADLPARLEARESAARDVA
jgi:DNA polymerase-3 subunit epsilon